jgi:hypothetical protein
MGYKILKTKRAFKERELGDRDEDYLLVTREGECYQRLISKRRRRGRMLSTIDIKNKTSEGDVLEINEKSSLSYFNHSIVFANGNASILWRCICEIK